MDALSEALRGVRVTGAILVNAELTVPWGYTTPPTRTVAPLVAPGTEHLILFHLVTEGRATARAGNQEAILAPGDIVIFPHGDAHELWNGSTADRVDTTSLLPQLLTGSLVRERGGGGGAVTRLICGYFGCDRSAERFFLAGLPPLFTVNVRDDEAGRWIESALQQSLVDAVNGRAGRSAVLAKLAETLCVEALCRYMDGLPAGETGWLAAAHDDVAGRVLACIHRNPARTWTLAELAREAGTSRTVLGERFTRLLGESPARLPHPLAPAARGAPARDHGRQDAPRCSRRRLRVRGSLQSRLQTPVRDPTSALPPPLPGGASHPGRTRCRRYSRLMRSPGEACPGTSRH